MSQDTQILLWAIGLVATLYGAALAAFLRMMIAHGRADASFRDSVSKEMSAMREQLGMFVAMREDIADGRRQREENARVLSDVQRQLGVLGILQDEMTRTREHIHDLRNELSRRPLV